MKNTVIVVDDSDTIRKFISFGLRLKGFQVITASDGQDALEKLAAQPVNIVLTDLNMPNMDGFELIENLREDPEYKKIPIIVLTTESQLEERDRAIALGADTYLIKPFKVDVITKEIDKVLNQK